MSEQLLARLETAGTLDGPARRLQQVATPVLGRGPVRYVLGGAWFGHPLHPLLVTVPIGAWTLAAVLDVSRDQGLRRAADRLVGLGTAGALPVALTGLSDWTQTGGSARRVGLVHAGVNWAAIACYGTSWLARRARRRRLGVGLSLAGMTLASAGGYLGGHLTYRQAVGVVSG